MSTILRRVSGLFNAGPRSIGRSIKKAENMSDLCIFNIKSDKLQPGVFHRKGSVESRIEILIIYEVIDEDTVSSRH